MSYTFIRQRAASRRGWGIQIYFVWFKNPKPMKEKKKEKLDCPNPA